MRALIITADLFEDSELKIPYQTLLDLGLTVDIVSIKSGTIIGKHGFKIDTTITLNEVVPKIYDILILPGGKAPSSLRKKEKVLEIAQYFFEKHKPVAAICHGPQILISAGLLEGRVVTGYKSIANELKNAGAIYKDEEVVIDKNLITSRQPSDLKAFMEAIKQCLASQKNMIEQSKKIENDKNTHRFIADCHLGKLAKYLRLMGFDTLFFPHIEDDDLVIMANDQDRIILTRDRALSQRNNAPVFFLEPTDTKEQLKTLIEYYHLKDHPIPFSRCIVCNTPLQVIEKEKIIDKVPEKVKKHFNYFEYCPVCDRIYWQGDHYRHMMEFLEQVLKES